LAPLSAGLPDPDARLSVREVKCTDPACATPEGVEVLITLTAVGWSATAKILQTAVKCERSEVESVVVSLCAGAGPRATAAAARRQVEAEMAAEDAAAAAASNEAFGTSSGRHATTSRAPLPMSSEAFAVRVLARLGDDFPGLEGRSSALRVLEAALAMERAKINAAAASAATFGSAAGPADTASAPAAVVAPAGVSSLSAQTAADALAAAAPSSAAAPAASGLRGGKPVVMPELNLGGGSRLLQKDGDEANEMARHTGGRGGGISCPCCNPDDPQFMVDKMLMM